VDGARAADSPARSMADVPPCATTDTPARPTPAQTNRVASPHTGGSVSDARDNGFGRLLAKLRGERGWSQGKLATQAGLDTSSISRYEKGQRAPDRETVIAVADAMALPIVERDKLLVAAGFLPSSWEEPLVADLAELLADPSLPEPVRNDVRTLVRVALEHAKRARER